MEVSAQPQAPAALPLGKQPPVLYRRLGGPQGRYERYGVEKNLFPLQGIDSRSRPLPSHYTGTHQGHRLWLLSFLNIETRVYEAKLTLSSDISLFR
jgi:hypothetical protein